MIVRINKESLKRELVNPFALIGGIIFAVLYILVSTLIINYQLIIATLNGSYSLASKIAVIIALTKGVKLLYNPFELSMVFLLGFLMGINLILIMKSLRETTTSPKNPRKSKNSLALGLGMTGFIATSGCASCGITLLSLLGPTLSITLLPYQTLALQVVSLGLLLFSLIYTLNRRNTPCVIVNPKS